MNILMKTCTVLLSVLTIQNNLNAQKREDHEANGEPVTLCCNYNAYYHEFSSMANWNKKVILVPQLPFGKKRLDGPQDLRRQIIAIDSVELANKTGGSEVTNIKKLTITNFDHLIFKGYDGIEGTAVIPKTNTIYFSIETNSTVDICYIVKGYIDSRSNTITLRNKIGIKKPADYKEMGNAGFESIAYLPSRNQLVVFFEKNKDDGDRAYLIDTTLLAPPLPVKFEKRMFFRLTDVASYKGDTLIAVNHHYPDLKELDYYIGKKNGNVKRTNLDAASQQMYGKDPEDSSYTGIVKIYFVSDTAMNWETVRPISKDNWEGISPFKKGFLTVIDGVPPKNPCRLSYFELTDF